MQERKIRPFARGSKSTTFVLLAVLAIFYVTTVPMMVLIMRLQLRMGDSYLDALRDYWFVPLTMIGLPLLTWFLVRRVSRVVWTIDEAGIQTPAAFGQPFGMRYTWEHAIELGYGVVSPWLNSRRVISGSFAGMAQPLQVPPDGLSPDDLRALLTAIVSFAPRETITPDLLVLEAMQRLSVKLHENGGPDFAGVDREIGEMRLQPATRSLASAAVSLPVHGGLIPVVQLLRAQAAWLSGSKRQAHEIASPLAAAYPSWGDACLVAGLAAAAVGDIARAEMLVAAATPGSSASGQAKDVVDEVRKETSQAKKRTVWLVLGGALYLLVSAGLIVGIPLLAVSGVLKGPVARAVLKMGEPILLVTQVVLVLVIVIYNARKRRREGEKTAPRSQAPPVLPENAPQVEAARQQAWAAIAFFAGGALLLAGTQVVAVTWPHLLAGEDGALWARGTLSAASVLVMLVSAVMIVRAIGTGALERTPAEAADADTGSLLTADIKPGWAVAAIVPLVAFGMAAFAVNLIDPGEVQCVGADSSGTRYGVTGSSLIAWDAQGRVVRDLGYRQGSAAEVVPWDLAIDDEGAAYIADGRDLRVYRFGLGGDHSTSFSSAGTSFSREINDYNLSCVPAEDGVLVLDEGTLHRISTLANEQVFSNPDLRYAEDFDVEGERIVVADTANGRLLTWQDGTWTSSDCLSFEGGYRYPVHVETDKSGRVFAVLSKAWDKQEAKRAKGRPLTGGAPVVWMGHLYLWENATAQPRFLEVSYRGAPINVGDIAALPDGQLLVSSLNEGWLYEVDPSRPDAARRLDSGEIGARLRVADRNLRVTEAGPQVLLSLAVVVPIGVGITGVAVGRSRRRRA